MTSVIDYKIELTFQTAHSLTVGGVKYHRLDFRIIQVKSYKVGIDINSNNFRFGMVKVVGPCTEGSSREHANLEHTHGVMALGLEHALVCSQISVSGVFVRSSVHLPLVTLENLLHLYLSRPVTLIQPMIVDK